MSEPQKRENLQSLIDWIEWLQTSGPGIDDIDSAKIMIAFQHHEVHEGNHYTVAVVDADVGPAPGRIPRPVRWPRRQWSPTV